MRKKLTTAMVALATAVPVFAEGESPSGMSAIESTLKGYIESAGTSVVSLLTAGAVIVGAFYLWRVLKRALGASK